MYTRFWLVCAIALLLSACVTVDPAEENYEAASKINVQLGIGYLQQNNMVLASEKLTKALKQNPKSAAAHNAYAILQERLLQKEKAEKKEKRHYMPQRTEGISKSSRLCLRMAPM